MSTLFLIESPGKKDKLSQILGDDYNVMATYGHIRDLPDRELGVDLESFAATYVVQERAGRTVDAIRRAAQVADRIILATDPDREGEAIAWHVVDALGLRGIERVTYNEITDAAVRAALAAPRPLDRKLVRAQEARRVLDRLVGYLASPAVSGAVGCSLTAGRVQSPAVRLVVDREREITAFRSTEHYLTHLHFDGPPAWQATWQPVLPEDQPYQLDDQLAASVSEIRSLVVTDFADTEATRAPPSPFTTSTLQQKAQAAFGFTPSKTMQLAQALYEQGAITYMRTDSPNLSDDAFGDLTAYAQAAGIPVIEARRQWKAKGNAQEAHEAIRPSHFEDADAGETDDQRQLYTLIRDRAIISQLPAARYALRTASLSADVAVGDCPAPLMFQARGRTLIEAGWLQYGTDDDDDDETAGNPVPDLTIGDTLMVDSGSVETKRTKAPARYKLATLVKALEAHGIGRPSTYAAILDNILTRQYIAEDKKGVLTPTEIGCRLVDALEPRCGFVDLDYTRALENELDHIAEGGAEYRDVLARAYRRLAAELDSLGGSPAYPCPTCSGALILATNKHGDYLKCTGLDCSFFSPVASATHEAIAEALAATADAPDCPEDHGPMRYRLGSRGPFYSCSHYPACKKTAPLRREAVTA